MRDADASCRWRGLRRLGVPACLLAAAAGCGSRNSESASQYSLAEARRVENLAAGKFLVASPEISDPAFARSVILLLRHDGRSTAGLIINRPSKVTVAEALAGFERASGIRDPVFAGGPVGLGSALALLRSRSAPAGASRVMEGCHLISSAELLNRLLGAGYGRDKLRVYMGYAGWRAGQLENEVEAGEWYIFPGQPEMVFDPHPDTVWTRLVGRLEQRYARRGARAARNVLYWRV